MSECPCLSDCSPVVFIVEDGLGHLKDKTLPLMKSALNMLPHCESQVSGERRNQVVRTFSCSSCPETKLRPSECGV